MPESGTSGSVRGAAGDGRLYRDRQPRYTFRPEPAEWRQARHFLRVNGRES